MSIAFFIYIKDLYILHNAHFNILEKFRFLIILTYSNKNKEIKYFSIYLNNYILSKNNFKFVLFVGNSPHTPSSFATVGSACGIGTGEARLTKCAYSRREPISSTGSDTLREKLHLTKSTFGIV